jgi:hypothetical protein
MIYVLNDIKFYDRQEIVVIMMELLAHHHKFITVAYTHNKLKTPGLHAREKIFSLWKSKMLKLPTKQ